MIVLRGGVVYEAWCWNDGFQRTAPKRVKYAICTIAHKGSNAPHVHCVDGFHLLSDGDYLLRRPATGKNGCGATMLCLSADEFAEECKDVRGGVDEQ